MSDNQPKGRQANIKIQNRMPEKSVFFERVMPVILVVFSLTTVILILFALGVLLGIVKY